jgi:hypothetical protein
VDGPALDRLLKTPAGRVVLGVEAAREVSIGGLPTEEQGRCSSSCISSAMVASPSLMMSASRFRTAVDLRPINVVVAGDHTDLARLDPGGLGERDVEPRGGLLYSSAVP